jgi:diguanylate cyclase (GGDEF)-like protein/putative nucleotidyltransferase with HDIG domain
VRVGPRGHVEELEHRLVAAQRRIAELEEQLATRSMRDPLTGLQTWEALVTRLQAEVDRCRRHGSSLSLGVLDIDGFQGINSRHGRETGDCVLKATGQALTRFTRASDAVCRSGGDEFIIALPETALPGAVQTFERLLLELEATKVGPVECMSAAVGLAEWKRSMDVDELLALAGERLRRARKSGGGRVDAGGERKLGSADASGLQDVIAGLAGALLERDRYTGEHSESIVELATQVARGLALGDSEIEHVRAAALLHDIGKVAVSDMILNKPAPLDESEWALMREHPVIGERILRAVPGLGAVARIVRHEHERWDGSGYPDGLAGDAIPIGARIILACDAYHAMTSDRPYRKAMAHAEAIRELGKGAGTQFDPQVTEVLIGCLYSQRQMGVVPTAGEPSTAGVAR